MVGFTIILSIFVLSFSLGLASLCTWIERKASALIQDRVGANRAGSFARTEITILKPAYFFWRLMGWLGFVNTLMCDSAKALFKEDFVPKGTSVWMHALAPFLAVVPVVMAFAVLPLGPDFVLFGETYRLQVAPGLDSGMLFFLAMGSLSVYGVIIAGFTANNKFSLLGALRASAQMMSYELSMGLSLVTALLAYQSLDVYEMVQGQAGLWGIIKSPMMFIAGLIFFIAGMAETKRAPFDLPESESELVAGYFTEYSGMKFLMFWLGEFAEIALVAVVMSVVFFGGWHPIPFVNLPEGTWYWSLIGFSILVAKVLFFCTLQIVIRWTVPRFRYDQLMNLGWKSLIEIATVNLLIAAAVVVFA